MSQVSRHGSYSIHKLKQQNLKNRLCNCASGDSNSYGDLVLVCLGRKRKLSNISKYSRGTPLGSGVFNPGWLHETSKHLDSCFLFKLITLLQAKELHIDVKYEKTKNENLDWADKL